MEIYGDVEQWKTHPRLGTFPDAVTESFRLLTLRELVGNSTAAGATRLFVSPAFEPVETLTVLFYRDEASISFVTASGDPWGDHLANDISPLPVDSIRSQQRTVAIHRLPAFMQGWEDVTRFAAEAKSCATGTLDGVCYFHCASGGDLDIMYGWFNPSTNEHPRQMRFVTAYQELKRLL